MYNLKNIIYIYFIFNLLFTACHKNALKEVNLEPNDKRPIYYIQVSDGDEVQLLKQQLGLEILLMDGTNLYFFDATGVMLDTLRVFGYKIQPADPQQIFYRVVKVVKKGKESDLIKIGVKLINREEDHWVVRGNLTQLNLLKEKGYILKRLDFDYEPCPREVLIFIKSYDEVQIVASFNIDIYTVLETKELGLVIHAGAFDYQIDLLRQNNFKVEIKPTIKEGEIK